MIKIFSLFTVLFLTASVFGVPGEYRKAIAGFKAGKIKTEELQAEFKKFAEEAKAFSLKKYAALSAAQKARSEYLAKAAETDKELAPLLAQFNTGVIRNEFDKNLYARVYAKVGKDAAFEKLDRELWRLKVRAAADSISRQLGKGDDDAARELEKIMREFRDVLQPAAIAAFVAKAEQAEVEGTALFRAATAEIKNYGKNPDPRALVRSRQLVMLYIRELFSAVVKENASLKKIIDEQTDLNLRRIEHEFLLELANPEAAYAKYAGAFGLSLPVKGGTMNEIALADTRLQAFITKLREKRSAYNKELERILAEEKTQAVREYKTALDAMKKATGK